MFNTVISSPFDVFLPSMTCNALPSTIRRRTYLHHDRRTSSLTGSPVLSSATQDAGQIYKIPSSTLWAKSRATVPRLSRCLTRITHSLAQVSGVRLCRVIADTVFIAARHSRFASDTKRVILCSCEMLCTPFRITFDLFSVHPPSAV